ncbi:MAG: hypothetical protein OEZ43_18385 [Gammaproteobacteria bacterium]|nr:hypothetical protein [Gammaproteobacteria bacterium]
MKLNMSYRFLAITSLLSAGVMSSACFHDEEEAPLTPSKHYAAISTRAADYSSGDISLISFTDYSLDNKNYPSASDTVVSTHGEYVYRIGRFQQDNITKFSILDRNKIVWQYSANGQNEEESNPYKMVFKNDDVAYVIRYGQPTIWIVDPNAATFTDFKTGEIDISAYGGTDGIPEVADALIINDKLYLIMQNLDRDNVWKPGQAYLAVFDTTDNSEVQTNDNVDTPNGVALSVANPSKMAYSSANNTIYIVATGGYLEDYSPDYTGGIESVSLSDYSHQVVIDDGDATAHPYGQLKGLAVLNDTRAYFVGGRAWNDSVVQEFNPSTGEVVETPLIAEKDITDIEIAPTGDLWVGNATESGITIFDTVDNSIKEALISTELVPIDIEFISFDTVR